MANNLILAISFGFKLSSNLNRNVFNNNENNTPIPYCQITTVTALRSKGRSSLTFLRVRYLHRLLQSPRVFHVSCLKGPGYCLERTYTIITKHIIFTTGYVLVENPFADVMIWKMPFLYLAQRKLSTFENSHLNILK